METAFGTKNVCRVVWGDSGEEPLPTRLEIQPNVSSQSAIGTKYFKHDKVWLKMEKKVCFITGANAGIGKSAAIQIACKVYYIYQRMCLIDKK